MSKKEVSKLKNSSEGKNNNSNLMSKKQLSGLNQHLVALIKGRLWLQILIGMILGIIVGVLLGPSAGLVEEGTASIIGNWLSIPGYLFLAVIQMIVVPLVFASVLRGVTSGGSIDKIKKKGGLLLLYLGISVVVAIIIGIAVGLILQPGSYVDPSALSKTAGQVVPEMNTGSNVTNSLSSSNIPNKVVSLIPSNPLNAMLNSNMVQVVFLSFIFGFALLSLSKKKAKPMLELMDSLQSVSMRIVKWIMYIAPLAVFGLLADVTMRTGLDVLSGLGMYVFSVLFALFILLIVFLVAVAVIGRRNPLIFLRDSKDALLMAFSTDSSAAVIPLSIKTAINKFKVKPSTAHFVIPVGATINMSGTALYQGLATIFMTQLFGMSLPLSALLALIVTAVGASIGTPSVPGVGIVVLSSVLMSAGVPLIGIPLILGVDRILEMSRAVLNVAGDLVGCVLLDRKG
jgi:Na+/H+-dicarboxylate symporter